MDFSVFVCFDDSELCNLNARRMEPIEFQKVLMDDNTYQVRMEGCSVDRIRSLSKSSQSIIYETIIPMGTTVDQLERVDV